jgi:hypothetical protein
MSLEAERVAERTEAAQRADERRARSERRGKDRRRPDGQINRTAPRRSTMKMFGSIATAASGAVFALVLLADVTILASTPWTALSVTGLAVVVSTFALFLGNLEQRLIEIRLELMMANGGMRQADRRSTERRGSASDRQP